MPCKLSDIVFPTMLFEEDSSSQSSTPEILFAVMLFSEIVLLGESSSSMPSPLFVMLFREMLLLDE